MDGGNTSVRNKQNSVSGNTHLSQAFAFSDTRVVHRLTDPDVTEAILKARGVTIVKSAPDELTLSGKRKNVDFLEKTLDTLVRFARERAVTPADIQQAIYAAETGTPTSNLNDIYQNAAEDKESAPIRTQKVTIQAKTPGQHALLSALPTSEMLFVTGPAGTGKTYLAVAYGISLLLNKKVQRIIFSRPAVEAGERLGFLPGDMKEKIDPYLRPIYDAMHDLMPAERIAPLMESGEIEIAPLAFMRGRTLARSFILLDEAQNTTPMQMRMFLTRLGEGSRMVITGDRSQRDTPLGMLSGLHDAMDTVKDVEGVRFVQLTTKDIVRHDLVARIAEAYEKRPGFAPS